MARGLQTKRFHIDIHTGKIGYCNATKRTCPYGGETGDEFHYESKQEAVTALEEFYEEEFEYLGEVFKKNIERSKNAAFFHMDIDERAANMTDELVEAGFKAKVAGNGKVKISISNKDDEKPGDELGDLNASISYNDSVGNRYSGTWMLSYSSPQNSWYGSSRLYFSAEPIRGLDKAGVEKELKRLLKNPKAIVASMREEHDKKENRFT